AAAHAWLAYWKIMSVGQGWSDDPVRDGTLAGKAAERAIILDPLDARGISIAGHVKAYLLHEVEAALALHQRAVSLNPNLPISWTLSACAQMYSGNHQKAVKHSETAISLSPNDPHVFFAEHVAMTAHMFLGNLDTAEYLAGRVLSQKPDHASALKVRVAILGLMGRKDDAQDHLEKLKEVDPDINIRKIISRPPLRPADIEVYTRGLRLAGVSE
ncbi:MAG: tetratricopeptide repeat protein, partial [Janthinobacterium lividum]